MNCRKVRRAWGILEPAQRLVWSRRTIDMKMHQPLSFVSLLATKSQMNRVPEGGTKLFASFRRCSADAKYHAGITCLIKKVALRGSSLCRWVRPLPPLRKAIPLCFLIVNRKIEPGVVPQN